MENEKESKEAKANIFEVLKEVVRRLKEEILIFAFGLALLVASIIISTGEFPMWGAITFIALYLIAVGCYFVSKTMKTSAELEKEASKQGLQWSIVCPPAFQNPFTIIKTTPGLRIVSFDVIFKVKNLLPHPYLVKVYIKSPTQAIGLALDSPIKVWKRAYGIIPHREEVELSLNNMIEQKIASNQEETYIFHGVYRPLEAFRDFRLRERFILYYRIYGESEDNKWIVDSYEKRLEIPFKEKVRYVKNTRARSRKR